MTPGVIVQARLGSTRLPRKVLYPILGKTMIHRVCERAERIGVPLVLAIPREDAETELARTGFTTFIGAADPLTRYYECATAHGFDPILRVTGDCPLFDPAMGRLLLDTVGTAVCWYGSNVEPRTAPDGLDCEIFSFEALTWAHAETPPDDREHVTSAMRRWVRPHARGAVSAPPACAAFRWSVDCEADWRFVCEVYRAIGTDVFGYDDVLAVAPGDACEHCRAGMPHLERDGQTAWDLHVATVAGGRGFIECTAPELAKHGGTRRILC